MDRLSSIHTEVERRVKLELIPVLLKVLSIHHSRRGLRDCTCSYCSFKRAMTYRIALARRLERGNIQRELSNRLKFLKEEW